ncbi:hypothetical protein PMIN01_06221 [Paraphaeosphaeria minitans]|uniref:Uncharacterized protein n=1 Tax=Paraphaeosphaeria minitans TaxID=565426 RepID=A0A9P6GJV5_9PLEO|nr:hypothetical protein PMIN01_06221 [Paraphaeosphaeria minitans]
MWTRPALASSPCALASNRPGGRGPPSPPTFYLLLAPVADPRPWLLRRTS